MSEREKKPLYIGHRQRLRDEVFGNLTGIADYKLLEMLLTFALPRIDTKPLARTLLDKFGTLRDTLDANREDLLQVEGMGPRSTDLWELMRELRCRYAESAVHEKETLRNVFTVVEMARARMSGLPKEELWMALVDTRLRLVHWALVAQGTINATHFYPQEIIRESLRRHAWGIILVHNHPAGTGPSQSDIDITHKLIAAAEAVDLYLLEHIVVTSTNYFGLREEGIFPKLKAGTDAPPF